MSIKSNAKIKYGKVDLPDELFEPKSTSMRISLWVPGDVLGALRTKAKEEGIGYQTLINRILREQTDNKTNPVNEKLDIIISCLKEARKGTK